MIESGQILSEGVGTFTPILNRLLEIAEEMIPYFVFIGACIITVVLTYKATKYILEYLKKKNMTAFYTYEDDVVRNKDGETFNIVRHRKPRKKIKWKYIRRFR